MVLMRLTQVMCNMEELDVRTTGFPLIGVHLIVGAGCLLQGVWLTRWGFVALRCDGVQAFECVDLFFLLITSQELGLEKGGIIVRATCRRTDVRMSYVPRNEGPTCRRTEVLDLAQMRETIHATVLVA